MLPVRLLALLYTFNSQSCIDAQLWHVACTTLAMCNAGHRINTVEVNTCVRSRVARREYENRESSIRRLGVGVCGNVGIAYVVT